MHRKEKTLWGEEVWLCCCEVCGQPITPVTPGGPVIPRTIILNKTYIIGHAHEGHCRQVYEERLAQDIRRYLDARQSNPG